MLDWFLMAFACFIGFCVLFPVIKFGFKVLGALIGVAVGLGFVGGVGYLLFF